MSRKGIRRRHPEHTFRQRLETGDTYGVLLALIIAAYFLLAFVGDSHWDKVALATAFAAVLLLTLHTSHVHGRWIRITAVLAAITISVNLVLAIIDQDGVTVFTYLWVAFIVASPLVILFRILGHPTVDLETILGALCAYMMIAIAFSTFYAMIDELGSKGFFAQPGPYQRIDFTYFSFIVLTTTGFGDLTPGTPFGKVLVSLEALIGQVFLVTIVASLVASYGFRLRPSAEAPEAEPTATDEDTPAEPT